MQIIPLNLDSVLLLLHNSKLAYSEKTGFGAAGHCYPGIRGSYIEKVSLQQTWLW